MLYLLPFFFYDFGMYKWHIGKWVWGIHTYHQIWPWTFPSRSTCKVKIKVFAQISETINTIGVKLCDMLALVLDTMHVFSECWKHSNWSIGGHFVIQKCVVSLIHLCFYDFCMYNCIGKWYRESIVPFNLTLDLLCSFAHYCVHYLFYPSSSGESVSAPDTC